MKSSNILTKLQFNFFWCQLYLCTYKNAVQIYPVCSCKTNISTDTRDLKKKKKGITVCYMESLYSPTCGSQQFTLLFNSNLIKQQLPRLHCPPVSYSYSKFSLFTIALTLQEMNCHKNYKCSLQQSRKLVWK